MTQNKEVKELEKQILSNIEKIRVKSLKKFLLHLLYPSANPYVDSRRAKYDYELAKQTLLLWLQYTNKFVEYAMLHDPENYEKAMRKALTQ